MSDQVRINRRDIPRCDTCSFGCQCPTGISNKPIRIMCENRRAPVYSGPWFRPNDPVIHPDFGCVFHSELVDMPGDVSEGFGFAPKDSGQFGTVRGPVRVAKEEDPVEAFVEAFEGINIHKGGVSPGSPIGCPVPEPKSEGDGKEGSGGE